MSNNAKIILSVVLLVLALGVVGYTYWPREAVPELQDKPAVVICNKCGTTSNTTWSEALSKSARDEGGFYMACPSCGETARIYSPDQVPQPKEPQ